MPRPKDHVVTLTAGDRRKLTGVVSRGTHPARMIARARILLELDEAVGRGHRKGGLRPDRKKFGTTRGQASGECGAGMEEGLEVSHRPHDPAAPGVGGDEKPYQLVGHVRAPIPAGPGHDLKQDSEYVR